MERDYCGKTSSVAQAVPELMKNAEDREQLKDYDIDAIVEALTTTPEEQWIDEAWNVVDEVSDLVGNDGPEVVWYTAEQDLGPYLVMIVGWPGGYIVRATERDDVGLFPTLEDAKDFARSNYGEFFV